MQAGVLPGKNITQLNLQTQRLLGQQSLGVFMNMRIDPYKVRADNERRVKEEKDITVKCGLIINSGENPTREYRLKKCQELREKFGVTQEQVLDQVDQFKLFSIKRQRRLEFHEKLKTFLDQQRKKQQQQQQQQQATDRTSPIQTDNSSSSSALTIAPLPSQSSSSSLIESEHKTQQKNEKQIDEELRALREKLTHFWTRYIPQYGNKSGQCTEANPLLDIKLVFDTPLESPPVTITLNQPSSLPKSKPPGDDRKTQKRKRGRPCKITPMPVDKDNAQAGSGLNELAEISSASEIQSTALEDPTPLAVSWMDDSVPFDADEKSEDDNGDDDTDDNDYDPKRSRSTPKRKVNKRAKFSGKGRASQKRRSM